jgi:pimeloyl-ACP methyl ester carboxylesterase
VTGGEVRGLEVPGATLAHRTVGEGPPLVLVHGSATDMTTWDGVVDELARDHRVTTYDRRGYGRSRHAPVRDHRVHARDLAAVLEQVIGEPCR